MLSTVVSLLSVDTVLSFTRGVEDVIAIVLFKRASVVFCFCVVTVLLVSFVVGFADDDFAVVAEVFFSFVTVDGDPDVDFDVVLVVI